MQTRTVRFDPGRAISKSKYHYFSLFFLGAIIVIISKLFDIVSILAFFLFLHPFFPPILFQRIYHCLHYFRYIVFIICLCNQLF
jgi:hypothetical protein